MVWVQGLGYAEGTATARALWPLHSATGVTRSTLSCCAVARVGAGVRLKECVLCVCAMDLRMRYGAMS